MELAGLAIGAVTLVGALNDCVTLISQIAAAKSLGKDYELLNVKLDIQKTLLMQWGSRVGLFKRNTHDIRLDDPVTGPAVAKTLAAIRQLLNESGNLQQRYGVKPARANELSQPDPIMSDALSIRLKKETETLRHRVDAHSRTPLVQKAWWAVHDKDKFDGLIQQLSFFISSLDNLVPDSHNSTATTLRDNLGDIQSIRHLQLILQASSMSHDHCLTGLAREEISYRFQKRILDKLWFRSMDDRKRNVENAHTKTLEWALNLPSADVPWDDLSIWLRSGEGVYWICGKAGSGKSTLMKYIHDHPQTMKLLAEWSGNRHLTTANFFLWNIGTQEQHSQEGLARGLLYHILEANPSLIPDLLPNMWRELHNGCENPEMPSASELRESFSRLRTVDSTRQKSFCFFIDGLDEYSGRLADGISFVHGLAKDPNIKVLVSSRPMDVCVQAFLPCPKLQLEHLNKKDIDRYITDTMRSHPYMDTLMSMDLVATEKILHDLSDKARGVFLWVVLACRSLMEGFAAHDYPSELQHRVNELPPELYDLFRHILNKIARPYRIQGAKLLRICYQRHRREFDNPILTLGLAMLDENQMDAHRVPNLRPMALNERRTMCKRLEARLRSRTCGLLEVNLQVRAPHCFCAPDEQEILGDHDELIDSEIDFMHRTVVEFLGSSGVWELDDLQIDDSSFDTTALFSLMAAYQAYLSNPPQCAARMVKRSIMLVSNLYQSGSPMSFPTLLHVATAFLASSTAGRDSPSFFMGFVHTQEPRHLALLLAVELKMVEFVRGTYWDHRFLPFGRGLQYPLLFHAVYQPLLSGLENLAEGPFFVFKDEVSEEMIEILLQKRCDINEEFRYEEVVLTTPWKTWLVGNCMICINRDEVLLAARTTHNMLKAGADLEAFYSDDVWYGIIGISSLDEHLVMGLVEWPQLFGENPACGNKDPLAQLCEEIIQLLEIEPLLPVNMTSETKKRLATEGNNLLIDWQKEWRRRRRLKRVRGDDDVSPISSPRKPKQRKKRRLTSL